MQVEYEEEPAASPRSAAKVPPAAAEDKSEDEEEQDEEEPMQVEGDEPKQKKKRIIKQRQSLAEKERGTTIFPTARIKKIIKADKELEMMTAEAVFMIAVTTEYFIKHFMEEGWTRAQMDKRKIVNYKDMAAVVARSPDFDFLKDVIPAPMPMSEALERRRQKIAAEGNPTEEDDSKLPPIGETVIPSTNPLYPNAIVKKPPNTHSKAPGKAKMAAAAAAAAAESAADESVSENDEERKKAAPLPLPSTPKVLTGKNAPTTPHGLTTRGSARRSLASTEVNHDAVEDIRAEADEAANDDNAVSEKMDED